MQAAGLVIEGGLRIGTEKPVRCRLTDDREKRGWYSLSEIEVDGERYLIGSYGIYRGTDPGKIPVRPEIERQLTAEQREAIAIKRRADAAKAKAAREAEVARAAKRADAVWRKCSPTPPDGIKPEYLVRKRVSGHGARYSPSGAVVIPMQDQRGRVHGLQFILSRDRHQARIGKLGRDKHNWPPGHSAAGRFFLVGQVDPGGVLLICEGAATGWSLFDATNLTVAVAFSAGNLLPVAQLLRKTYPRARLLICADDDFASLGNPGRAAADAAALACDGAVILPQFASEEQARLRREVAERIDWSRPIAEVKPQVLELLDASAEGKLTDFNDLAVAEGLGTVNDQVRAVLAVRGWDGPSRASTPPPGGAGRAEGDWHFDLERLLGGYSLIYSTDTAFDGERSMIVGLGPLRAAAGKALVREWLEHPARRTVLPEEVGFDPAGEDPAIKCNLWGGWPTVPRAGRCERLLELIDYLCNHDPAQQRELSRWLLRWIAYPIQHPGAKMQTAVLMHGPEGTGKNTLFGAVRRIYGRYAVQFSQVELESNFNGWASGKLLGIGNEVVSRAELYHIQGRLKSMITEPELVINEKMLPARSEQNHCNFVFFSNRIDIAKLDQGDRRYCVVWTPAALEPAFYREVAEELRNGGVEAFHDYLLHLDLGDFSPHTKPPETSAKQDLVELGMDSTERFYRDWTRGDLDLPAVCCRSDDLYSAYRAWTIREGIGKPAQKQTLLTALGKRPGVAKRQERYTLTNFQVEKRTVVFVNGSLHGSDDGGSRADWIGRQVEDFSAALALWSKP